MTAFVLFCLLLLLASCKKEEATFKGKPARYWITMLEDLDPKTREEAIVALGAIGPEAPESIPALLSLLRDDQPSDQIAASCLLTISQSLARIGKLAVPTLLDELRHSANPQVRRYAAIALGDIDPASRKTILALGAALKDEDEKVREFSANSPTIRTRRNS